VAQAAQEAAKLGTGPPGSRWRGRASHSRSRRATGLVRVRCAGLAGKGGSGWVVAIIQPNGPGGCLRTTARAGIADHTGVVERSAPLDENRNDVTSWRS